ncbi:hypothetical protein A0H81_14875 [Grifola frondosa]|uniref:Alpha-type protein kinase domain-containing protein n=1 Tax=Grifola frondosa TaxID=5627 RepID=A0A1C7LMJ1_GRIFR|nr:hypothetical protein A0H81_14875 [Grifola frondosa]
MPPRKTTQQLIGDVTDTIKGVSVHVGARELKTIAFNTIKDAWARFSDGFPLHEDDLILRDKGWAYITPKQPDRDVLEEEFWKKDAKGVKVFQRGKGTHIQLHMPNALWREYDVYATKLAAAEIERDAAYGRQENERSSVVSAKFTEKRRVASAQSTSAKSSGSINDENSDLHKLNLTIPPTSMSVPGESSKHSNNSLNASYPSKKMHLSAMSDSPDQNALEAALRAQNIPTARALASLFTTNSFNVLVHPVLHVTSFDELCEVKEDFREYFSPALLATISLETYQDVKHGSFKKAVFGTSDRVLFRPPDSALDLPTLRLCAKQTFYVSKNQRIPHDGRKQAKNLITEVQCLVWARALLDLAYAFVEKEMETRDITQLPVPAGIEPIPKLRFVEATLAVEQGGEQSVYLLEEVIDTNTEGIFKKYINNDSPDPLHFDDATQNHRAQFLSFTQHVQYVTTGKLAFVTDYQGGHSILSDPQIVTIPRVGHVFASGNLPEAHRKFESDHNCSKFCIFFDLPKFVAPSTHSRLKARATAIASTSKSGLGSKPMSIATTAA